MFNAATIQIMIVLFTDFGAGDIYVGQVKAAMRQLAPSIHLIDLLHDAPDFAPQLGTAD